MPPSDLRGPLESGTLFAQARGLAIPARPGYGAPQKHGDKQMILSVLTGLSMVVLTTTGPVNAEPSVARLSAQRKNAAVQTYITRATECVARKVAADPRFVHING